jgi:pimeloyl-ACP methyl ester carboxylesterase
VDQSRSAREPRALDRALIRAPASAEIRGAHASRDGREVVVAVHGLWMIGSVMGVLRRLIEPRGFEVATFGYASIRESLDANAESLASFVARVRGDTVHLLGHSLGCVVIRALLERHALDRPGRIVCLGPPFRGSVTAERVARLPGGAHVLGRSMRDLIARGGFTTAPPGREIGIIAGRLGFGMGRLFGAFEEPNDGMVTVAETRLDGAADHIVLPVAHTSLLWSREVARQTERFLRTGKFDRA